MKIQSKKKQFIKMMKTTKQTRKLPPKNQLRGPEGGRPAGSKDNKPRIKRVPVLQPPPPLQEQEAPAEGTTPLQKPRKKVEI